MAKRDPVIVIKDGVREHPAVKAWEKLGLATTEPDTIECLKERKSKVYRLCGAGPANSNVIAKSCSFETVSMEKTIYGDILPKMPVTGLRCYGSTYDGASSWLFLEDAGESAYVPSIEEYRRLAGRWLGVIQGYSAGIGGVSGLPNRELGYYLGQLTSSVDSMQSFSSNLALSPSDVAALKAAMHLCNGVASHWDDLQEFCETLPKTLVHGDFVVKNIRVRQSEKGLEILPFDWDCGGWGTPLIDLAQACGDTASPNIKTYLETLADQGQDFNFRSARQLTNYATILRCVAAISWVAPFLEVDWLPTSIYKLRVYSARLAREINAAGWIGS